MQAENFATKGMSFPKQYLDYTVRNMNLHLPSGNRTFVDTQAVVEVIGDAGCIRAAHLTLSGEGIQNFVLCVSAQALRKFD